MPILCLLIGVVGFVEPALAGPGGKIARAMFETFWGKIVLGLLTVFFLPLIIYVIVREKIAERRARKFLATMANKDPLFDWLKIKERATDCFHRVHSAWRKEDMAEASKFMTDWYWQNQQMVYLDRWEREGLVNHCDVKKINWVKPLLFSHRNDSPDHEGSMVVLSIEARMKDYLAERDSGKVVEGSKRFKDVETVWSFTLVDGQWKVSNIEEDDMSLEYANLMRKMPNVEEKVTQNSRA